MKDSLWFCINTLETDNKEAVNIGINVSSCTFIVNTICGWMWRSNYQCRGNVPDSDNGVFLRTLLSSALEQRVISSPFDFRAFMQLSSRTKKHTLYKLIPSGLLFVACTRPSPMAQPNPIEGSTNLARAPESPRWQHALTLSWLQPCINSPSTNLPS
jgi:hypothetical protein